MNNEKIVSFIDEPLILVDENDNETGYMSKELCHQGEGILHRAFSIFIFNDKKDLLLQIRSSDKLLWADYWSNTVCSHPRKGETIEIAAQRRLDDEMGIQADLKWLFKFQYQAKFKQIGSENELCHVFIGKHNGLYYPNPNEIKDLMLIPFEEVEAEIKKNEKYYTPWFKIEWKKIISDYKNEIIKL
jgi:isopentenyl-diphosphate delta-isomerase